MRSIQNNNFKACILLFVLTGPDAKQGDCAHRSIAHKHSGKANIDTSEIGLLICWTVAFEITTHLRIASQTVILLLRCSINNAITLLPALR